MTNKTVVAIIYLLLSGGLLHLSIAFFVLYWRGGRHLNGFLSILFALLSMSRLSVVAAINPYPILDLQRYLVLVVGLSLALLIVIVPTTYVMTIHVRYRLQEFAQQIKQNAIVEMRGRKFQVLGPRAIYDELPDDCFEVTVGEIRQAIGYEADELTDGFAIVVKEEKCQTTT